MTVEVKAEAVHVEEPVKATVDAGVAAVGEEAEVKTEALECEKDETKPDLVEKSSSYREESNFLSDLKEHEKKALNELKAKLEDAILNNTLFKKEEKACIEEEKKEENCSEIKAEECEEEKKPETSEESPDTDVSIWGIPLLPSKGNDATNVVVLKFLRAREFNVTESFEMLKKTLQWRKDFKIDTILDEEFGADFAAAAYMGGADREGHPICYNIFGVLDNQEIYEKTLGTEEKTEQFVRWRVQLMEKGIQKLDFKPGCVSSLVQVNDLKNSPGPSKKEVRVAVNKAVALLQDNYPEFVAKNVSFICFDFDLS